MPQMKIAQDTAVTIDYTLRNDDGDILDQSTGGTPLVYLHGHGNIIPGLEAALAGHSAGDSCSVRIDPEQAYGLADQALIQVVPRDRFQGVDALEVGMQFRAQTSQGPITITVTSIEGNEVTVDGNHPLAGVFLNFDVIVREVREATSEEIDHGHIHSGSCCGGNHGCCEDGHDDEGCCDGNGGCCSR
ncbi:MAG: FKBP-type peptidyl-prolyl cis-trans isomerase SlyD [Verrucomicrobia bacterium ADurb.Bin474]|nr:MAG: FKBP-type peptidyl-prolyl cis-trans isomerase SlyD [Verrucomicrobia bacterium ADurb.Bin474]